MGNSPAKRESRGNVWAHGLVCKCSVLHPGKTHRKNRDFFGRRVALSEPWREEDPPSPCFPVFSRQGDSGGASNNNVTAFTASTLMGDAPRSARTISMEDDHAYAYCASRKAEAGPSRPDAQRAEKRKPTKAPGIDIDVPGELSSCGRPVQPTEGDKPLTGRRDAGARRGQA